jgi:hypothetical protein
MNNSVFGTQSIVVQGKSTEVLEKRAKQETSSLLPASFWFLACRNLQPWRWKRHCSVLSHCYATTERKADIQWPFVGNASVITFQLLGSTYCTYCNSWITKIGELCFLRGPFRDTISKGLGYSPLQFCMGVCEERTWAGGRGIAIVGAVNRKPLVKTLQAGEDLACSDCDSVVVILSYDLQVVNKSIHRLKSQL